MVFSNRDAPIDDELDADLSAYVPGWSTRNGPFDLGEFCFYGTFCVILGRGPGVLGVWVSPRFRRKWPTPRSWPACVQEVLSPGTGQLV